MKERFKLPFAVFLVLKKDGMLLMQRRYQTGHEDGNYGLVSGHLDGDETAQQAMVREAKEEAGIDIDPTDLTVIHVSHHGTITGDKEYINAFLLCSKWKGEPKNLEPDKCDSMEWFPMNNLPDNTIEYVRAALGEIDKRVWYSNWGWKRK